mgnify:CR=1 FL=1
MDAKAVAEKITELEFLSTLSSEIRGQIAEVFVDVSDILQYEDGEAMINGGYLSFDTGMVLVDGEATLEWDDRESIEIQAPVILGEMAQFKTADIRSATVRAKGKVVGAQFYWDDLYRMTRESLPEESVAAFQEAVQVQSWERFEYKEIINLPLISDLSEEVRTKVCRPLSFMSDLTQLKEIDTLFNVGAPCLSTGYLLVSGQLKLLRTSANEVILSAPNILGIFPNKSDKGTEWSATAMANGEATVLKFSWDEYTDQLVKNLTRDEQKDYVASMKKNGSKHFWH